MFIQAEPISGGAGWVGAGLLGMVLAWLFMKHLPDKDKQIKEIIASGREEVRIERETGERRFNAAMEKLNMIHASIVEKH